METKKMKYKLLAILLISVALITLVQAVDFIPQGDINLRGTYAIKNATTINSTGNISTESWFKGLFNWTIVSNFLSFDGNTLTLNDTQLNETINSSIDLRSGSINVNSSDWWDGYNTPSDLNNLITIQGENISAGTINFDRLPTLTNMLTLDWANLTNKFITAVGDAYIYMSGTTAMLNETKLNSSIRTIDTATNTSMKNYVDSLDTSTNTSMKNYVDGTFITQANEGNLNVNSSDYWDNMGTINSTQLEDSSGELNIKESWLTTFWNKIMGLRTTDNLTEGSNNLYDNQTWNETRATTLYSGIEWDYNQTIPANTYADELNNSQASWSTSEFIDVSGDTMSGDLDMSWNNIDNVDNYTGRKINVTCCVYLGTLQAYDGNSINVQPTGDLDDFFSFKTPSNRPTIKREGGKFIYFDSSNVYDVGISLRDDDTYSGTLNYEKDTHKMTLLGKASPVAIKTNSEYNNYFLFETYDHQPQLSVFNGTILKINDSLEVIGYINSSDWTNVSITESQINDLQSYRLDSWNNLTGIPHATPSNGDTTHFSLADEIYDFVIGLGYLTTETLWNGNYSTFLTHINWGDAVNGTLAKTSDVLGWSYYNSSIFDYNNYYLKNNPYGFYNTTSIPSYVETEVDPLWTGNQSSYSTTAEIIAFGYYNSTDFVITDYFTKTQIENFGYYNSTDFSISDYFTSAEVLAFNYYNSSDFSISDYVTSATLSGYNYYNASDFSISDYATNVKVNSLGNWSNDKSDYWNTSLDLDTVIATDEITELKIDFNTVCAAGNHLYVSGNNLACEADDDTTYTAGNKLYLSSTEFNVNDTEINESVEAYGYSTTSGTVTSVSTDDTYLTGGAITTTGTITFNTTLAGTSLAVDSADKWDALNSPSDINAADITDDGTYRLNSWNNLTGIPHATPTNADVTHFSLSDEIYDFVIGLGYLTVETLWNANYSTFLTHIDWGNVVNGTLALSSEIPTDNSELANGNNYWNSTYALFNKTYADGLYSGIEWDYNQTIPAITKAGEIDTATNTSLYNWVVSQSYSDTTGTVTSIATTAPITGGTITTTGTISLTACSDTEIYKYNSTSATWECEVDAGTEYSAGNGITITGSEINHTDTSSQASSENSGNTFIQDIILDTFGHITSIVTSAVDLSSYVLTADLVGLVGNWSADKSDYWNASTDLDTVISDDEIAEGKIAFSTACAAGNHYYLNGNDLACEADDDTTYTAGNKLYLSGTEFNVNDTEVNESIEVYGYSTTTGTITSIATTAPILGGTITTTGTISLDTATPSDGDTTHASTADQIFDYIVSLNYVANAITSLISDTTPQLGGYLDTAGQNIGSTTDEIENVYVATNSRIYFGDGQEASVYYNGTVLIIS